MPNPERLDLAGEAVLQTRPGQRPRLVLARDDVAGAQHGTGRGARILVVEDDYLVSGEIEAELGAAGFEIVGVATSARDAIRLAREEKPHLVIMDIRLEGAADGVDAAIEIFNAEGIRSLFASAYQDAETRRRAEPSAPLGWLAKPYTMQSLVSAVRRALRDLGQEH